MKKYKQKPYNFFFCKVDEKNTVKLINLDSYLNKYSFKVNSKLILKKYLFSNKYKIPINNYKIKNKTFIQQYLLNV